MSNSVPQQQSRADAARSDAASAPHADTPLPDFQTSSPIELEIARSERASAALAATRALARAAFTDSQLAAEEAAGDADIDTSGWVRTEYAALDHAIGARAPGDDPASAAPAAAATGRNLVAGTFNPGITSQHGRAFPGASIANSPIRTRTGNHARFLQESRLTPRAAHLAGPAAKIGQSLAAGPAHDDRSAVIPMLAAPAARRPAPAPRGAPASESLKFALAAGLGGAIVLMGGGVAWKAGWLPHAGPASASLITARVGAQAEAARLLAASPQETAIAPPAATRSNEEVDAALAAAARAAAVPVASVHAAGPSRVARSLPPVVAPAGATIAPARSPVRSKDGVAAAIANAQARADNFLSSGSEAGATASTPELEHEQ